MVRPKRNKKPMDRVKNEIFNSFCFSELKNLHPKDYWAFIESKIVPVVGDLTSPGLGFSDEHR